MRVQIQCLALVEGASVETFLSVPLGQQSESALQSVTGNTGDSEGQEAPRGNLSFLARLRPPVILG